MKCLQILENAGQGQQKYEHGLRHGKSQLRSFREATGLSKMVGLRATLM